MKTFIVLVLFIGIFMITHGIYEQKLKAMSNDKKIVYKFIPRTYYEEQLSDNNVMNKLGGMFSNDSTWIQNSLGETIKPKEN
jgi:hypothetical protein